MLQIARDFFTRHKSAKACHVVLDRVFDNMPDAVSFKKSVRAHKVTSYLRNEFETPLKEKKFTSKQKK